MIIEADKIRIAVDPQDEDGVTDIVTGAAPRFFRETDIDFELAFFFAGVLITPSNFATVGVKVTPNDDPEGDLLMEKSISLADLRQGLTLEEWEGGTYAHAVISFTNAETAIDLKGEKERDLFLFIEATSNLGKVIPLGKAVITVETRGRSMTLSTPPVGASIVPSGAAYDGGGEYELEGLTEGRVYHWAKGTNDTNLTNGTEVLTASGIFIAQGTSVVMAGTASAQVTATVRWPMILTADQVIAREAGRLKTINDPGVMIGMVSENGQYLRLLGVTNEGMPFDEIRSLV